MAGTTFSEANWSGYASAQVQASYRPGSAITGFTFIVDIADLGASFGSAVQSDGADIRVTDGTSELPYDLIDWAYNAGSPTGFLRVKSDSATAGTSLRVYAGYTPGTAVSYDATETYGSDNAYDSDWNGYYALGVDATDRTVNARDMTTNGTPGSSTGPVTGGRDYDGSTTYESWSGSNFSAGPYPCTIMAWIKQNATGYAGIVQGEHSSSSSAEIGLMSGTKIGATGDATLGSGNALEGTANGNVYQHYVALMRSTTDFDLYKNGAFESNSTTAQAASGSPFNTLAIGARPGGAQKTNSEIDDVQFHNGARSANWIDHEYDQTNDNAAFWGTWIWTAGGGGPTNTKRKLMLLGVG